VAHSSSESFAIRYVLTVLWVMLHVCSGTALCSLLEPVDVTTGCCSTLAWRAGLLGWPGLVSQSGHSLSGGWTQLLLRQWWTFCRVLHASSELRTRGEVCYL